MRQYLALNDDEVKKFSKENQLGMLDESKTEEMKSTVSEFTIGEVSKKLIIDELNKLDKAKQLREEHLALFDKFSEPSPNTE